MPNRTVPANGTGLSGGMERKEHMATKSLTTPVFGIPSAEVLATIEAITQQRPSTRFLQGQPS
jgi:hypothetical protein